MLTQLHGISFWLLIISLTLLMGSCGDSTTSSVVGASISVTVVDGSGNKLPNVPVVLGYSSGAMKTHGTTDANGQITFDDSPANATITAVTSTLLSGATATTYSLAVQYDVNAPVILHFPPYRLRFLANRASALGTVTVNVTNILSGITQDNIYTSNYFGSGSGMLITRQTITIYPSDLQSDGKLSITVIGKDVNSKSIGYGRVLNQTFTDGMTVDINVDQPMSYVQYHITNIPTTVMKLDPFITISTNLATWWSDASYPFVTAPSSVTEDVAYIPELEGQFTYGLYAYLDQNSNGVSDSWQYFISSETSTIPSNQTFDFSQALSAPSNLAVRGANTATPTLSWNGVDPDVAYIFIGALFRQSSTSTHYLDLMIGNLSPTRTSITFPELPDSLATLRPVGVDEFHVETSTTAGGFWMLSMGEYSSSQALAPALNRQLSSRQLSLKKLISTQKSKFRISPPHTMY